MSYDRENGIELVCDRPGCTARIELPKRLSAAHLRRQVVELAEAAGWQVSAHVDIPLDFCPGHVDLTRTYRVTRLYDEHGKPVVR